MQMHTNTRDDHAFNINFVKAVARQICLYDKTRPEYRNKDEHDKAWDQIASEVNENVPHCKERWRNLRACLTRHLKNSKQQTASGNTNYKPYYLAEHMKFVLPYTKSRQRDNPVVAEETTSPQVHVQKIEVEDYDEEKLSEPETPPPALAIQTVVANNPIKEIISPTRFVFVPPISSTPIAVKRSATAMEQETDTDNGKTSTATEKKLKAPPDAFAIKEMEDAADLNFFKSLLPDIRQMTPTQKRKFKMGIFELINNIVD